MSSIFSCCFSPQALARPNPRSPNVTRSSPKNRNRNPKFKLKTSSSSYKPLRQGDPFSKGGGEATTYTRLPPKEDFALPSFKFSHYASKEVKLSESDIAKFDDSDKEVDDLGGEEADEDEADIGSNLGLNYGRYEVFEVNSDFEDENDDDDEDYEQIDGEEAVLGFKDGKFVDFSDDEGYYEGEEDDPGVKNDGKRRLGFEDEKSISLSDSESEDAKEKGLPAVMRCFDRAKIYVKAGNGGNGVVAFRREKYVPLGGPSGGDGGRGGNVYVEVDGSMNSLLPFRNGIHFRAGRGRHGQGSLQNGAKGEDVVVRVAPGTIIREAGNEEVLLELVHPGQRALLLPGGRGGRGNASFKSGTNKVPKIAENGEEGAEMWLDLELKLVADVGIVGAPNAGKSTLLSVISAAQPAIANYPFTTLLPNLGVVSFDYDSTMVVADLPGLLEGAHRGFGLGHEFLRHTERCSALVHIVDGSLQQPEFEFDAVRLELELFSPELAEKPFVVAYNKMDLPEARGKWPLFQKRLQARGIEPFCMSAVMREGTHEVICAAYELLHKSKEDTEEFGGWVGPRNLNHVADMIQKQRSASINDFEISYDKVSNAWNVVGFGLQRFVQMTNWRYVDSERRFQHVLEACGVNRSLMSLGVKEGDTVIVGEMELVWHDSVEGSSPSNVRRRSANSAKWAEWK